jgi:hypothetical protein
MSSSSLAVTCGCEDRLSASPGLLVYVHERRRMHLLVNIHFARAAAAAAADCRSSACRTTSLQCVAWAYKYVTTVAAAAVYLQELSLQDHLAAVRDLGLKVCHFFRCCCCCCCLLAGAQLAGPPGSSA